MSVTLRSNWATNMRVKRRPCVPWKVNSENYSWQTINRADILHLLMRWEKAHVFCLKKRPTKIEANVSVFNFGRMPKNMMNILMLLPGIGEYHCRKYSFLDNDNIKRAFTLYPDKILINTWYISNVVFLQDKIHFSKLTFYETPCTHHDFSG